MRKPTFGQIATGILVGSAILNVAFRFLPTSTFTFRAWEGMVLGSDSVGAFRSNEVYDRARAYGDVAGISNLRDLRQYRREKFTSDRCGNRNSPGFLEFNRAADLMIIGTSFMSGSGLSDDETLSAQLSQKDPLAVVYNAGGMDAQHLPHILSMANAVRLRRRGIILLDIIDRSPDMKVCESCSVSDLTKVDSLDELCPRRNHLERLRSRIEVAESLSPLAIYGQSFRKWFENDWFLPNPFRNQATEKMLRNDRKMIFLPNEIDMTVKPRDPAKQEAFILAARKFLGDPRYEYDLRILLIPNKSEVYASLTNDPDSEENKRLASAPYLMALQKRLDADGVPTLNLTLPMQNAAEEALKKGELLYWADDTHWNAAGVRVAADALMAAWGKNFSVPPDIRDSILGGQ